MQSYFKIPSKNNRDVILRVYPGHFVMANSHSNQYMDVTPIKCRISEAQAAAKALSEVHYMTTPVDTIVCMDGMEVVGGFLGQELKKAGVLSMNMHNSIYVITPEYNQVGQIFFRDNIELWIRGKNVLLLFATATTGRTVSRAVDSLNYYGAHITGISAIFSVATKIAGIPVVSLFSTSDIPDYKSYRPDECPLCRDGVKVDALCNGFGYTEIK
ncbi:MAG: orotate phosphoribosyltransferase [Lachnospiraceae bacterium]|nr:orotate phosphoribosyltransferase [Lachnospiraceae bacterium]